MLKHILEAVQCLLPAPVAFYANFDAAKNHLFASTKVYAQLHDVSIFYLVRTRLDARLGQPDVVEKGAGRALDVLDPPPVVRVPELAVPPADHLGLETDGGRRGYVVGHIWLAISLGIPADADDGMLVR